MRTSTFSPTLQASAARQIIRQKTDKKKFKNVTLRLTEYTKINGK